MHVSTTAASRAVGTPLPQVCNGRWHRGWSLHRRVVVTKAAGGAPGYVDSTEDVSADNTEHDLAGSRKPIPAQSTSPRRTGRVPNPAALRSSGRARGRDRRLTASDWNSAARPSPASVAQEAATSPGAIVEQPSTTGSPVDERDNRTSSRSIPAVVNDGGDESTAGERRESHGEAGSSPGIPTSWKQEAQADGDAIADKLIALFEQRSGQEWRKLLAFSKQWPSLADKVFARIDVLSKEAEEAERALELRRLGRRLCSVHTELAGYNRTLAQFRSTQPEDWEAMVTDMRDQLPDDFFEHLESLIQAVPAEESQTREELVNLMVRLLALVSAYDQMSANEAALESAVAKFEDLLQVESLQEADTKIDELAASGQLDPALLLTMAKAYSAAKDTDVTREEVKDIMAHLYFKAKESFARMQPPEIRILKYLLSLEDPRQRDAELHDAFIPGADLETASEDLLSTTPEKLMASIEAVLNAFESSRGQSTMLGQAGDLMRPEVIRRMQDLRITIQRDYL